MFQRLVSLGRRFVAADLSLALEVGDGGVEHRLRWERGTRAVEMEHMRGARRLLARALQVKGHGDIQSLIFYKKQRHFFLCQVYHFTLPGWPAKRPESWPIDC